MIEKENILKAVPIVPKEIPLVAILGYIKFRKK